MKRIIFPVIVLIFFVLLPSCNQTRNIVKILQNSECDPPCWLGVKPNITTKDEALNLLIAHPKIIKTETINEFTLGRYNTTTVGFSTSFSRLESIFVIEKDLISYILLDIDTKKMELSQGIELFGIPEKLLLQAQPCKEQFFGQSMCLRAFLIYPEKNMILSYEQRSSDLDHIDNSENRKIDRVFFYGSQENLLSKILNSEVKVIKIDWPGYSVIDLSSSK